MKSVFAGSCTLVGRRSGNVYVWETLGEIQYVEYQDLLAEITNRYSKYIYEPLLLIEDEDVINKNPKLKDLYDAMIDVEEIEDSLLNDSVEEGTLPVGKYVGYTLEWQWPYESGEDDVLFLNDINDTAIGDASAEMDVNFRLIINVVAEATPQAVAMDENGNVLYEESINPSALVTGLSMLTGGLLGLLLLLLFWRRRIYVTGLLDGYADYSMKYKRKESVLSVDGRFVFEHMPLGKRSLVLCDADGNELSALALKLKRDSDTEGIRFEEDDDRLIIYIGKKIKAIELYLELNNDVLTVLSDKWAAIDKDQNVYSPEGIKEPDDYGRNETVAGLMVDEHGRFEIRVK